MTAADRPQPRFDVDLGGGMTTSVGRLRKCNVLDWKFTVLSHNTIRGAAGAALLNAELLKAKGYLGGENPSPPRHGGTEENWVRSVCLTASLTHPHAPPPSGKL